MCKGRKTYYLIVTVKEYAFKMEIVDSLQFTKFQDSLNGFSN